MPIFTNKQPHNFLSVNKIKFSVFLSLNPKESSKQTPNSDKCLESYIVNPPKETRISFHLTAHNGKISLAIKQNAFQAILRQQQIWGFNFRVQDYILLAHKFSSEKQIHQIFVNS